jgi:tungstate transport system ATP-binding protein
MWRCSGFRGTPSRLADNTGNTILSATPLYSISHLQQSYQGRQVLNVASLCINEGDMLALVGPSGAGKSTLLRLLNFLEPPTAGEIIYAGQPMTGQVPLNIRRQITTVFQRPVLQRGSVRSNAEYGLRLRGERGNGNVSEILAEVGLENLSKHNAQTLSGGEMQRVALARALVVRPRVLLLDEPTANLDPYNVNLIEQLIRTHNQKNGTTIVIVTHNVFQAKRLAGRTGLMLNGSLVELNDTDRFFASPNDPRTSAFVRGEMVW